MPIKFRKQSVATNVENRLLNFFDGVEARAAQMPNMPDPVPGGAELDQQLSEPVSPVAPDDGVLESELTGGSALEGLIGAGNA